MKLETRTMQILKNFAMINPSMLFREGVVQSTIAPQKTVLARTTLTQTIPKEFAIFELSRFLGVLSLFNDPDLEFEESKVVITQGRQRVNYTFADPDMVIASPTKTPNVENPEVCFKLTADDLRSTLSALGALQATHIIVAGDGETVTIGVGKPADPTADTFKIDTGINNHTFKFCFKADNMKILQGDYDIVVSSKNIAHLKGNDVEYWMMADSNFSNFTQ